MTFEFTNWYNDPFNHVERNPKKKRRKRCAVCGKLKSTAKLCANPYDGDKEIICDDCYFEIIADS